MLSITHKHMQHSTDGQLQIINYIPLLVAEISFLLLHYPSWGTKFLSLCFTIVNDLSKLYPLQYTRAVQKVSDLNFFRLNKSSTGSVLHCGCGGDIYAHVWISSRLQIASVAGSRSMIVYVLWALGGLSIIAKWRNELSSVIALNFAKSLAILKLKLFERFNRLSGMMPWVSHE